MKPYKTLFCSALFAAAALPASAVDASGFYIGIDGRADQLSWQERSFTATLGVKTEGVLSTTTSDFSTLSFPQSLLGMGLKLGYRFSPYLAIEGGYTISAEEARELDNDNDRYRFRTSLRDIQLDVMGYWPLGETGRVRPFISLGMSYTMINARLRAEIDGTDEDLSAVTTPTYTRYLVKSELNWRLGTGVEVRISDGTYGRLFVRYTPYSFDSALDNGATFGFSINTKIF